MNKELAVGLATAMGAAMIALIVLIATMSTRRVIDALEAFARSAGWQNVVRLRLRTGVAGLWNGVAVRLRHQGRYKSTPERLITTVERPASSRVIIKRKFKGFWTRPLTWFGPPLVETHAQDLWVRSDEVSFVNRLFADSRIVSLIEQNLVEAFDEVRIDRSGIRITRALDEKNMRQRMDRSRWGGGYHEPTMVAVMPEEWELAQELMKI